MTLAQDEKDLVAALGFDEAILVRVKEYNQGQLSVETVSYVDPTDPYHEKPASLLICALLENVPTEQHDLLVERLRPLLSAEGCLPFLVEQSPGSASLAVLKTGDKMDIPVVMGTILAGMNYDITDDDILSVLRDWDRRYGIEFLAASGDALRLKFATLPDDLDAFLEEVTAFCPTLLELAESQSELEASMAELQRTKKLSFWWD